MTIQRLLAPITGKSAAVSLPDAEKWMQGRTLYGGASALLAYTQATRAFPDLPPLRAAQIGFVAPIGGDIELRAEVARQGRSVTQIRSEIHQDGKLALTAFFLFAEQREPNGLEPRELVLLQRISRRVLRKMMMRSPTRGQYSCATTLKSGALKTPVGLVHQWCGVGLD